MAMQRERHAAQHLVVAEALHDRVELENDVVHYSFASRRARSRAIRRSVNRVIGMVRTMKKTAATYQAALVELGRREDLRRAHDLDGTRAPTRGRCPSAGR